MIYIRPTEKALSAAWILSEVKIVPKTASRLSSKTATKDRFNKRSVVLSSSFGSGPPTILNPSSAWNNYKLFLEVIGWCK